jgi:hypothetical protein
MSRSWGELECLPCQSPGRERIGHAGEDPPIGEDLRTGRPAAGHRASMKRIVREQPRVWKRVPEILQRRLDTVVEWARGQGR